MPIPLIIQGATFQYPTARDPAGWGQQATAWSVAVTNQLAGLVGPADITTTVANIANNQTVPAAVAGLFFNSNTVVGATIFYNVYRVTSTNEVIEQGIMFLTYKPIAMTWDIAIVGVQNSNVIFSVAPNGQVMYTDDNMPGSNYNGSMTFRAFGLTFT